MRKFLTVSVCLFASLMANAKVVVTPGTTDLTKVEPDVITISGPADEKGNHISSDDVKAARKLLNMSAVKIVTDGIELTADDWKMIIKNYKSDEQLIKDGQVYNLDISETHSTKTALADAQVGYLICAHGDIKDVTLSRNNDIPDGFFSNSNHEYIETITIPDQMDGTEAIKIGKSAFNNLPNLGTLYIGSSVVEIGEDMCNKCEALTTAKFNTPQITVLPKGCFQQCSSLKLIDLPYNLEVIGNEAFQECPLQTISFPNTLKEIKANAFLSCSLQYVVIPQNVKSIEKGAFQNNTYLTDVYVMGANVQCSEGAFAIVQNCRDFKNTDHTSDDPQKPADKTKWISSADEIKGYYNQHPVILHFPNETDARKNYLNPYFKMLNDTIDDKDILAYITDNGISSNDDAKAKVLAEKLNLWKGSNTILHDFIKYANDRTQECPFAWYQYTNGNGTNAKCRVWREEYGYYSDENISQGGKDPYAGWKQFLLVEDNAKNTTQTDDHRVNDRWYSMCFPFPLTANQIRTAFGAATDVCKFVGAWEDKKNNTITFRFCPVLSSTVLLSDEENSGLEKVTEANVAYMIHPASKKADDSNVFSQRIIPNVSNVDFSQKPISTIPVSSDNTLQQFSDNGKKTLLDGVFEFVGNYDTNELIPLDCYYFSYTNPDDASSLILNHLKNPKKRNAWTSMTALLRPCKSSTTSSAKVNIFSFAAPSEQNIGETTGINEINYDRQNTSHFNQSQKIYNMNGQVVKEGTSLEGLSKGIYIMNGKKYIVK